MAKKYNTKSKGNIGESKIAKLLNKLNKGEYTIYNNVIIEKDGVRAEIDHVIISSFGIFIIETKNYNGVIYGSVNNKYWYKNNFGKGMKFYSPVEQNDKHVEVFLDVIGYENLPVYSLVVFIDGCRLEVDCKNVIYSKDLISTICKFNQKVIDRDLKYDIVNKLECACGVN